MKVRLLNTVAFVLMTSFVAAQAEFSNWQFGNGGGFVFTPNGPQIASSAITSVEGVASISDSAGNLLFYSNGSTIWDRSHQQMQNGDGLEGHPSASQGVAILPVPGDVHRYYIFTVNSYHLPGKGLCYSIVNMQLNGGLGAIETNAKNIQLAPNQTERIALAPDNSCGFWVVSHEDLTNRYEARRITSAGISSPVYSYVGPPLTSQGVTKFSPDFRKVITTGSFLPPAGLPQATLINFDPGTGEFSNPLPLPTTSSYPYGACFSPDGTKVYTNEGSGTYAVFYQLDLSSNIPSSIIASRKQVGAAIVGIPGGWSDLQLGPDGRIYFSRWGYCIGVIPEPDKTVPSCGFTPDAYCSFNVTHGLPNRVLSRRGKLILDIGTDTTICPGTSLQLSVNNNYSVAWSTGSTANTITVSDTGTYWVTANNGTCEGTDTILVRPAGDSVVLRDSSVCICSNIQLSAGEFETYHWSTQASTPSISVDQPGSYWVRVTDKCGITSSDTAMVTATNGTIVTLPGDTVLCNGARITIHAGNGFASYQWNNGGVTPSIQIEGPGIFWVTTVDPSGCISSDTIISTIKDCGTGLWVPTAFTPNNDGTNDIFKPGYYGVVESFYIAVYNRWGELVFSSNDPDSGWDGKQKGMPANTQAFAWVCQYKLQNQEPKKESGTVVLIR